MTSLFLADHGDGRTAEQADRGERNAAWLLSGLHESGAGLRREEAEEYLAQVGADRQDRRGGG